MFVVWVMTADNGNYSVKKIKLDIERVCSRAKCRDIKKPVVVLGELLAVLCNFLKRWRVDNAKDFIRNFSVDSRFDGFNRQQITFEKFFAPVFEFFVDSRQICRKFSKGKFFNRIRNKFFHFSG